MSYMDAAYVLLNDSKPEKRREAANVLVHNFDVDEKIINILAQGFLDDDKGVNDICFRGLLNLPGEFIPYAANTVSPYIIQENIELRNLAGDLLLRYGKPSVDSLLIYLKSDDFDIRKFACDIIGLVADDSVFDHIIPLLEDNDINVKSSALEAIGNIRSEKGLEYLKMHYYETEDLKPVIIDAIGKIGGNEAEEFLRDKLINELDVFLQTACIDALAECGSDPEICNKLLNDLPNVLPELKVILLKTIFAVAFRTGYQLKLPDEYRYIAHNALQDDDPDIRTAGLVALGTVYSYDDIPGLVNEILKNNSDTQQMILYNLVSNSEPDVIRELFIDYHRKLPPDMSGLGFLSLLSLVWEHTPQENAVTAIDIITNILLNDPRSGSAEVFELLLKIDRGSTIEILANYLLDKNENVIFEDLEIIQQLCIHELKNHLTEISGRSGELGEKAKAVLKKLGVRS